MNSYWIDSANKTNYPKLTKDIVVDVCIIGGGLTGITSAYLLSQEGLKVALVDKDKMGMGVSAYTTGKLTSQHDIFYSYLMEEFGIIFAKKYLEANEEAIKLAKDIINKENINCDFEVQDSYIYTQSMNDIKKIEVEADSLKALGINSEYLKQIPLPTKIFAAVKFPNQAQFHIRKYILGLLNSLENKDCQMYENTKVVDVKQERDRCITYLENNKIISKYAIIASHYPVINFPGYHFLKMYQDMSYVIMVDPKENVPDNGMYITSESPTKSIRTVLDNNGKRFLLVTGLEHKVGANDVELDNKYKELEDYIKTIYPNSETLYKWSNQDCISLDKVPYIGEFSKFMPNIYIATGYKKWGMSTSHVAAQIITDKILGNENKYAEIFNSRRLNPIRNYSEFGNILKQTTYSWVLNRITPPKELYENLNPGTGGVVKYNGKKLGIYKDENGEVFAIKPYCGHLGCELSWNNLEKTWDCPCHGSRYDYKGRYMIEPTKKDLKQVKIEKENKI